MCIFHVLKNVLYYIIAYPILNINPFEQFIYVHVYLSSRNSAGIAHICILACMQFKMIKLLRPPDSFNTVYRDSSLRRDKMKDDLKILWGCFLTSKRTINRLRKRALLLRRTQKSRQINYFSQKIFFSRLCF